MNDDQTQDAVTSPEIAQSPETPVSSQTDGSEPSNMPPEAPESPQDASTITSTEDQNGGVNKPESDVSEPLNNAQISEPVPQSVVEPVLVTPLAPTPLTPQAPQPQSSAQQDQTGFIRALLAKAQAKIQSNKQKKLDRIILFAQKKKIVANEDIQLLLHISSATATRYLVKLVQQGRLSHVGNPRDAKYQFLR